MKSINYIVAYFSSLFSELSERITNFICSNLKLEFLYNYLNSLTLLEESALYHIILLWVIGNLSFNLLSVFLGNEIIEYFKLETKYPKLAGF